MNQSTTDLIPLPADSGTNEPEPARRLCCRRPPARRTKEDCAGAEQFLEPDCTDDIDGKTLRGNAVIIGSDHVIGDWVKPTFERVVYASGVSADGERPVVTSSRDQIWCGDHEWDHRCQQVITADAHGRAVAVMALGPVILAIIRRWEGAVCCMAAAPLPGVRSGGNHADRAGPRTECVREHAAKPRTASDFETEPVSPIHLQRTGLQDQRTDPEEGSRSPTEPNPFTRSGPTSPTR